MSSPCFISIQRVILKIGFDVNIMLSQCSLVYEGVMFFFCRRLDSFLNLRTAAYPSGISGHHIFQTNLRGCWKVNHGVTNSILVKVSLFSRIVGEGRFVSYLLIFQFELFRNIQRIVFVFHLADLSIEQWRMVDKIRSAIFFKTFKSLHMLWNKRALLRSINNSSFILKKLSIKTIIVQCIKRLAHMLHNI